MPPALPPDATSFNGLTIFADSLRARSGWRRYGLAFIYGALSALAYAPADIVPILWISYLGLIFLLQGAGSMWRAFAIGWCFAFGFFTFDLYWTAASMFVDIEHFWWAVPLAAFGLPAFFALYYGFAAALAQRIGLRGVTGASASRCAGFLPITRAVIFSPAFRGISKAMRGPIFFLSCRSPASPAFTG